VNKEGRSENPGYLDDMLEELASEEDTETKKVDKKATKKKAVKKVSNKTTKKKAAKKVSNKAAEKKVVKETEKIIADIENKFKDVTGIEGDIKPHNMAPKKGIASYTEEHEGLQVKTNKSKSDKHGEVFTPLWLVDHMIDHISNAEIKNQDLITEDLCAGYGQFTLRLLRRKYEVLGENFDVRSFLQDTHVFIELQPHSCFKLMAIYGKGIRLLMGDAAKKGLLPDNAYDGIWIYSAVCDKWYDRTKRVHQIYEQVANKKDLSWDEKADLFEERVEAVKTKIEERVAQ
jgi:hypothetical protein